MAIVVKNSPAENEETSSDNDGWQEDCNSDDSSKRCRCKHMSNRRVLYYRRNWFTTANV